MAPPTARKAAKQKRQSKARRQEAAEGGEAGEAEGEGGGEEEPQEVSQETTLRAGAVGVEVSVKSKSGAGGRPSSAGLESEALT